ncbi:DUF2993 domain-containing protein [Gordonia sp. TBRC 11910]|uniref:DUF2993 domain-containing protein n=1 Tax=Gordonia asplenii TaxID=2725283 RepID=A0A848L1R8_9ACTN|nr:DUF2993 domain-containing protein [Gordonia asplenii]NMO04407.1 DUF2993 domain-containing protein [Gordonia asplenii]
MPPAESNPPTQAPSTTPRDQPESGAPRLRRAFVIIAAAVVVAVVAAFVVDTGLGARGESRLSHSLQTSPRLEFAPEVTFGGFPFVTHAAAGDFTSLTVTARGVALPRAGSAACRATQCWAELGVNATGVRTGADAWSLSPDAALSLDAVTAYAKLDSVNLGRMLDLTDLSVNTPAPQGKAGGGGPGDGLLERTSGVLLTGTVALPPDAATTSSVPPSASKYTGPKVRVSVTVDLSVRADSLILTPTDFYDGPEEHASDDVPTQYRAAVLRRFGAAVPMPPLPWGVNPTSANSAGSDVLIKGSATARVVRVDQF